MTQCGVVHQVLMEKVHKFHPLSLLGASDTIALWRVYGYALLDWYVYRTNKDFHPDLSMYKLQITHIRKFPDKLFIGPPLNV